MCDDEAYRSRRTIRTNLGWPNRTSIAGTAGQSGWRVAGEVRSHSDAKEAFAKRWKTLTCFIPPIVAQSWELSTLAATQQSGLKNFTRSFPHSKFDTFYFEVIVKSFAPDLPTKRDNAILQHVFRMGMTTPEVIHHLFFADKSRNAVTKVTTRLTKAGYLRRHQLCKSSSYFTLGAKCHRLFGVPRHKTMPRGEQILPVDYATLIYCCTGNVIRKRLLPNEVAQRYPWFSRKQLYHPHYLDRTDGVKRLATIRVEISDFPDAIVRKHLRQVHELRNVDPFRALVERDEYMFIVITTTVERRLAIVEAIEKERWYPTALVFDFPQLLNLV